MAKPEKHLYIVVCKNEKQAKHLYERMYAYWKSQCSIRSQSYICPGVYDGIHTIRDPLDAVLFVPERKMCYLSSLHNGVRIRLFNGEFVDHWLDRKEQA